MRAVRVVLVAGNLAVAALMAATSGSQLGRSRWHDEAAYAALVVAALAASALLRRRRVTTLLLASAGAWSMLTGFLLVYQPFQGRWMEWWHGVASVGFLLAFLAHWARNNARLVGLVGRLRERPAALFAVAGAWAALGAAALLTWAAPWRATTSTLADRYLDLVTTLALAWTGAVVLWGALIVTGPRLRDRLARPESRNRLRGAVDASLWISTWLATLTGFAVLYLTGALRALDAYWLMVAWHVVVSVMLLGLAAWHVGFNVRPLRAHAR